MRRGNNESAKIMNGNTVNGDANVCQGNNSSISGGSNNFIAQAANNIQITNSVGAVIPNTINNFVGVALESTSTLTSDAINLMDAVQIFKTDGVATANIVMGAQINKSKLIEADYTIDGGYSFFYVELSTININITIDPTLFTDYEFTFKRLDASGYLVTLLGTGTLDGVPLPTNIIMAQYDTLKIKSDGTNLFII